MSDQNNWGKKLNLWGGGGGQNLRGDLKFRAGGGLQHFTSRKLAEANLLLNIKKMLFYVSDAEF